MSLEIQSLAGRANTDAPTDIQTVLVRTPDGVFHVDASLLFNFFQTNLRERVEYLELGSEGPQFWPLPRKLTLNGAVSGEVSMDGSADVVMDVTIPAGSFPISAVDGLSTELLNLRIDVDNKAEADHTHIAPIADVISTTYADIPQGVSVSESDTLEFPVSYAAVLTVNSSANRVGQLAIGSQSDDIYFRGYRLGAWGPSRRIWHSGNFDPHNWVGDVTLAGDFLPDVDNVRSLGSPERVWRDVYIGPGSLYLNGQKVLEDTESGTIRVTADENQNIAVQTKGTGDVELNPLGTGLIQLKGPVVLQAGYPLRSSNGAPILFDDSITFSPGEGVTGPLRIDGNTAWHAGNFTPSNYAALNAGVRFTGIYLGAGEAFLSEGAAHEVSIRTGQLGSYRFFTFAPEGNFRALAGSVTGQVIEADATTSGIKLKLANKLGLYDNGIANAIDVQGLGDATQGFFRFGNSGKNFGWNGTGLVFGSDTVWHAGNFAPSSKLDVGGTAFAAAKLATARQISLTGPVTASGTFDGTGNLVLNTAIADAALPMSKIDGLEVQLAGLMPLTYLGMAGGVATLDENAKIPANQLPSYVDDVLEYANLAVFPLTGEGGKLYLALDSNLLYRWSGSTYVNISAGSGTADAALKWVNARTLTLSGKAAGAVSFDGSADITLNVTGLTVTKGDVGLGNVDNTSDVNKPVSTAQQAVLDLKAPLSGTGAYGNWNIGILGNAATATKLAAPRSFSMSGPVTAAAVDFDGSGNVSFTTAIANGALSIAMVSGLSTQLSSRMVSTVISNTALNTTEVATGVYTLDGTPSDGPTGEDITGWRALIIRDPYGLGSASTQYLFKPASNRTWVRNGYIGAGWSPWAEVWNSSNLDPSQLSVAWADALTTARNISLSGKATGTTSVGFNGSDDVIIDVTALDVTKADVGLSNVDNTSDMNKPISTAVQAALDDITAGMGDGLAPLDSPDFIGIPKGPTAAQGTNTTQLATTAFVQAEIAADAPTKTGGGASGTWGIGITGNAATATTATSANTAKPNTNVTSATDLDTHSMLHTAFNGSNLTGQPSGTGFFNYLMSSHQGGNYVSSALAMGHGGLNETYLGYATGASADYLNRTWTWKKIWHEGNFDPTTKMSTGAFGLGGVAIGAGADLNNLTATGFYRGSNPANAPAAGADHDIIHIQGVADGDASQISITGTDQFFFRCKDDNTTWGGWRTVWHSGNIGAVPDATFAIAKVGGLTTALSNKVETSLIGAASGIAPLGADSKIPSAYLPSYVDDVLEYANFAALPATGETGKLYVTLDDNKTYRWGGSAYVVLTSSPGSTDAVPEGSVNLYFTDARARAAITGAASTILDSNVLANRALMSNASGKVVTSTVTSTELGYLAGVTSAIQTQIDGKAASNHNHSALLSSATSNTFSQLPVGVSIASNNLADAAVAVDYATVVTFNQGNNRTSQLALGSQSADIQWRGFREADGGWQAWRKLWHSGNFDPTAVAPKANPTFTGKPTITTGLVLGTAAGNTQDLMEVAGLAGGNNVKLVTRMVRRSAGTDWTTEGTELRHRIDATDGAFMRFVGTGTIMFGDGTTERHSLNATTANFTGLQSEGNNVWHAGNFTPADKADAANAMVHKGLIGNAIDLNTYTTTGIWHQNTNANAAAGTNYPIGLAGRLEVYAQGSMIYQTYTAYSTNSVYRRAWYSTSWSPWYEMYDSRNLAASFVDTSSAQTIGGTKSFTAAPIVQQASYPSYKYYATSNAVNSKRANTYLDTSGALVMNVTNDADDTSYGTFKLRRDGLIESSKGAKFGGNIGVNMEPVSGATTAMAVNNGAIGAQTGHLGMYQGGVRLWQIGIETDRSWKLWCYDDAGAFAGNPLSIARDSKPVTFNSTGIALDGTSALTFSSGTTRQMFNLWGGAYGIGVQNNTQYFRTGSPVGRSVGGFAWFRAGVHDVNVFNPGTGGTLLASLDGDGNFRSVGELVSTNSNQLRLVNGNYGLIGRQDGATFYWLPTNSGDQYGTWNSLRPFSITMSTGDVSMSHNVTVGGVLSAGRIWAGWDSGVANSISTNAWFRASGQTGVYFNDYGGGWYMTDTTYVRAYNGKAVAAADFVLTSDERLKAGIRDFEYRGRLRPVNYVYRKGGKKGFGFIAQEVDKLYPEAVGRVGKDKIYQLSYGKLTAVISAQVNRVEDDVEVHKKEITKLKAKTAVQGKRIKNLEQENQELKSRMDQLEALVQQLLDKQP